MVSLSETQKPNHLAAVITFCMCRSSRDVMMGLLIFFVIGIPTKMASGAAWLSSGWETTIFTCWRHQATGNCVLIYMPRTTQSILPSIHPSRFWERLWSINCYLELSLRAMQVTPCLFMQTCRSPQRTKTLLQANVAACIKEDGGTITATKQTWMGFTCWDLPAPTLTVSTGTLEKATVIPTRYLKWRLDQSNDT